MGKIIKGCGVYAGHIASYRNEFKQEREAGVMLTSKLNALSVILGG